MATINYEKMHTRLELIYKMLQHIELFKAHPEVSGTNFSIKELDDVKNLVATLGLNLTYINRIDDTVVLTRAESINARGISQVIADGFCDLSRQITQEAMSEPQIEARAEQMERMIREGVQAIVMTVKNLIEGPATT